MSSYVRDWKWWARARKKARKRNREQLRQEVVERHLALTRVKRRLAELGA